MSINHTIQNNRHTQRSSWFTLSALLGAGLLTAASASAQCSTYPIAFPYQTLANTDIGSDITLSTGTGLGNFAWLTWTGNETEQVLANSLTPPGDSYTYIDPDDAINESLVTGDWMYSRPQVPNSKYIIAGLNSLSGFPVMVPVWDQVRRASGHSQYHFATYAVVQIMGYNLTGSQNQITVQFLGFTECGGIAPD